jgi:mitochondrial fission protein ELM1
MDCSVPTSSELNIWRLLDGRPGHENQVLGLTEAISRRYAVQCFDVVIDRKSRGLQCLWPGRFSIPRDYPQPDLLIGAGHSTHIPLLVCQHRYGGKTVVVMKPSLPTGLFDACLIPAHDDLVYPSRNVIRTEGSLNRVRPSGIKNKNRGLFLIGGPSKHFHWSDESVMEQICSVFSRTDVSWTVVTSDRTPQEFAANWRLRFPQTPLVTPKENGSDWLPRQLAECGVVWVTCDSISMIYESLTAGSRVGLLEMTPAHNGRVLRSVHRLLDRGLTTSFGEWMNGRPLPFPAMRFSESDRCSSLVVKHCLSSQHSPLPKKCLVEFLNSCEWIGSASRQLSESGEFLPTGHISNR